MIVLGIDTSGPTGGVALVSEDGVIAECILDVRRTYSEHLMTALDFMLRESSIGLADIDGVCVSRGPGSYTGLRMGVTVGKTLCYCLGIPLAGVSTLRAVAEAVAGLGVTAVPLIDARRSRVYASAIAFEYGESVGTEVIPEALIEVSELKGLVASLPGRLCFLGPGAARHGEELRSCAPERSCVFPADQSICRPSHVARLGAQKLSSGESEVLFEFEPVYFRASEAEVRWSESHRT